MDEQQLQQQIVQLVLAAMQGDQRATLQIQLIMQAAQQGDPQAVQVAQMIQAVAQQMLQQQVQAAKFGAKLNYIRQLKGQCPEGYEMQYYKSGGLLCKRCMKKQDGGEVEQAPRNVKEQFQAAKCGTKMKKKAACGTKVEADKCGSKMKKKEIGGTIESEKCGGKPKLKKKACGGDLKKALSGMNTSDIYEVNPNYRTTLPGGKKFQGKREAIGTKNNKIGILTNSQRDTIPFYNEGTPYDEVFPEGYNDLKNDFLRRRNLLNKQKTTSK